MMHMGCIHQLDYALHMINLLSSDLIFKIKFNSLCFKSEILNSYQLCFPILHHSQNHNMEKFSRYSYYLILVQEDMVKQVDKQEYPSNLHIVLLLNNHVQELVMRNGCLFQFTMYLQTKRRISQPHLRDMLQTSSFQLCQDTFTKPS